MCGSTDYAGPSSYLRLTQLPCCSLLAECVARTTQGQDGSLFSFPLRVFHPLQHAGLSRRTPDARNLAQVNRPQSRGLQLGRTLLEAADRVRRS